MRRFSRAGKIKSTAIQVWQIFFFISISSCLGSFLANNGWINIDAERIEIIGNKNITPQIIIDSSGMKFPKPLLTIDPRKLKKKLKKNLPIETISIRRNIIPTNLKIEIKTSKPIAFASKINMNKREEGVLDKNGNWTPIEIHKKINPPMQLFYVEGWMENHKVSFSELTIQKDNWGSPLEKIIFLRNGDIALQTTSLKEIQLGSNVIFLDKKIKALNVLLEEMPSDLKERIELVDLRDYKQPELQITKP